MVLPVPGPPRRPIVIPHLRPSASRATPARRSAHPVQQPITKALFPASRFRRVRRLMRPPCTCHPPCTRHLLLCEGPVLGLPPAQVRAECLRAALFRPLQGCWRPCPGGAWPLPPASAMRTATCPLGGLAHRMIKLGSKRNTHLDLHPSIVRRASRLPKQYPAPYFRAQPHISTAHRHSGVPNARPRFPVDSANSCHSDQANPRQDPASGAQTRKRAPHTKLRSAPQPAGRAQARR